MAFSQRAADFFRDMPVTKTILLLWVVGFLSSFFFNLPIDNWLAFDPYHAPNLFTGLVTYPLIIHGVINLLFSGLMLYWFGGSLERSWDSRNYLLFLLVVDAVAALVWYGGLALFSDPGLVIGTTNAWMMIAAVIVAWAWTNPNETILFWFVLPLQARWVGWLTIVLLYFSYAGMADAGPWRILLGLFALGGVGAARAYVWYRRQWGWVPRRHTPRPAHTRVIRHPSSTLLGALTRPYREWQRRRRIAYLQKTIMLGDEDKGTGTR